MSTRFSSILFSALLVVLMLAKPGSSQDQSVKPFSRLAIGAKVSTLGIGVEAATLVTNRSNVRAGFNFFSYDRTFTTDGVSYKGRLHFRSVEGHYDWFPFGGSFHLSPGVLVYNGNRFTANSSVPGGQTFTLDGTTYLSDPNDPITGAGKVDFVKAGPMFTVGWGNLIPRNHRHFSVPFELGVIYTGSPRTALSFVGSACDPGGLGCLDISSNPPFQANVRGEQKKLDNDISAFRFYPIISTGIAFNF